ncbi:MAG: GNAT family N-acetyltransferase [Pseudomonadota bacterium]
MTSSDQRHSSESQQKPAITDKWQSFEQLLPYLRELKIGLPKPIANPTHMAEIRPPHDPLLVRAELAQLPADRLLMEFRHYQVYFGSAQEIPLVMDEIARLREVTFRAFQEGNGEAEDRDAFDLDYVHVFVWDVDRDSLVGAYRLGQTDKLRAARGNEGVYLSQFFDFDEAFFAGPPVLEIGRSFVVPDYQKNHHSLYLLWCGISRYLIKHPQYRLLYGLASMSRLYDARAMAVMRDVLLEPRGDVRAAGERFDPDLGERWQSYLQETRPITMRDLSQMVKALQSDAVNDAMDVPALIRHYHKLGATFHEIGVDHRFNNTPGLLLRLHAPSIPPKYLKMYFGDEYPSYVNYSDD